MSKVYKKYGATTGGYRGERAILKERVIEGLEQSSFDGLSLQLTANAPKTIYLTSQNFGEGQYIILPNAQDLWLNWQVSVINETDAPCPIYYYADNLSQLHLFKEVSKRNMTTCILLDDATKEGEWTTLRTTDQPTADLLNTYTASLFDSVEISYNVLQQDDSDESDENITIKVPLGEILAGTAVKSIYVKTLEQFSFENESDSDLSNYISVSIGTDTDEDHFIENYNLTTAVSDNNFTKDYFEETISTTSNEQIFAYFKGSYLSLLNAGRVKIVVEKAKVVVPTYLNNPIIQTSLPIGVIMNYAFSVDSSDIPDGFWKLDGSIFPNAATAIPQFVEKLNQVNNALTGEKLIIPRNEWETIERNYGSCGKFCWVGSGLRFPKITCFIQGLSSMSQLAHLTPSSSLDHYHLNGNYNWGTNNGWFTTKSSAVTANMPSGGGSTGWNGSGNGGYHSTSSSLTGNQITSLAIYQGQQKIQPLSVSYPYIISVYNKLQNTSVLDISEIIEDSVNKANISLNNLNDEGRGLIANSCIPDFINGVEVSLVSPGTFIQVQKNSFVVTYGGDPYIETYYVYVSPDGGITKYVVGYRGDDTNAYTQNVTFTFFIPAGWYFTNNAENGYAAHIYPLKGA